MQQEKLANFVLDECASYYAAFQSFSHVAKLQFEHQRWNAQRSTNFTRLNLANRHIELCYRKITAQLPEDESTRLFWSDVKALARKNLADVPSIFFESFLYDIEQALYPVVAPTEDNFVDAMPAIQKECTELISLHGYYPFYDLSAQIIRTTDFAEPYEDIAARAALLANHLQKIAGKATIEVTLLSQLFYRNQHAYLVGLLRQETRLTPLAIPFINTEKGIRADAFLFTELEITRIFEFTRSYFLVNTADPEGLVAFLQTVMPHKRTEQLVINLGYQEWGKMLVQHNFKSHASSCGQKLHHAPGIRGMVMLVFTLPDYPLVFKVIKDDIPLPKTTTREKVLGKYKLVAEHDRVGRLADVQLFKHWTFPVQAFDDQLLADLKTMCREYVHIHDREVIFVQLFSERKMVPLNIFLEENDEEAITRVIIDYGRAIKEMAMSNLFPGDLLTKNFGVTSDLRVVFYDYDEVVLLTDCDFLKLPVPRYEEELWDSEPWIVVHENDIFPEELENFMVPEGPYRQLFREHHGDLFGTDFWNHWKDFHKNKGFTDIQPY